MLHLFIRFQGNESSGWKKMHEALQRKSIFVLLTLLWVYFSANMWQKMIRKSAGGGEGGRGRSSFRTIATNEEPMQEFVEVN
jgi:hypothetical protein